MKTLSKEQTCYQVLAVYGQDKEQDGLALSEGSIAGCQVSRTSLRSMTALYAKIPFYDALLLDLQHNPHLGLRAIQKLYDKAPNCPILVLTADAETAHQALCFGAQAHLHPSELGDHFYLRKQVEESLHRKNFEKRMVHYQQYHPVTGLANRDSFLLRLQQALLQSGGHDALVALVFVELENYKTVNSALGHQLGDHLLCEAAYRMQCCLGPTDLLAHTGGDEFAIITELRNDVNDVTLLAQNLLASFESPVQLNRQDLYVELNIGIALSHGGAEDAAALLQQAGIALQKAKLKASQRVEYFTPELAAAARVQIELFNSLRQAQERGEMFLEYQPQIDLASGQIHGAEALLRWKHPTMGLVSPAQFIPVMEQMGTIHQVGTWVIREACRMRRRLTLSGQMPHHAPIAVNLSMRQFADPQLLDKVGAAIHDEGIAPHQLEIELTESLLMDDIDGGVEKLNQLKSLGVRLSLDDFGTGYSSLSYLKQFPLDVLKIDRSFIACSTGDSRDASIIRAIIALAHNLNFSVIAEGVETQEQLEFLRREGCETVQGYLISKPVDEAGFHHFLATLAGQDPKPYILMEENNLPVFGDQQIDDQHHQLFTLLDNLIDAINRDDAEEVARESLDQLLALTKNHFAAEERLMRRIHYPGILRHQLEHQRMKQQVRSITLRYRQGTAMLTSELLELLKSWIGEHVQTSDRKIQEYMEETGLKPHR